MINSMDIEKLQNQIEKIWDLRQKSKNSLDASMHKPIIESIKLLDSGIIRVANPEGDTWVINEWVKKAILLYFVISDNKIESFGDYKFFDKIPMKTMRWEEKDFKNNGFRMVPGSFIRFGSYVGKNTVIMPSFINIGAYVDDNTMIDSNVLIGSAAQIGKNCHISDSVGIGGVLEPLQANPVIIEDDCFIGAKSEIVEGVKIGKGSVLGMGVLLGSSTTIYDLETKESFKGYIPPYSVVIPGSISINEMVSKYAAIVIKKVDESTRKKVGINELLRM